MTCEHTEVESVGLVVRRRKMKMKKKQMPLKKEEVVMMLTLRMMMHKEAREWMRTATDSIGREGDPAEVHTIDETQHANP